MRMLFRATRRLCCVGATNINNNNSNNNNNASSSNTRTPVRRRAQIAVIGSGPSGCYVAQLLTKKCENLHVDIYEKLPVPFGLVRYGVAPDHPEVKNVEERFLTSFRSGRVTFIGNINIGRQLPIAELLQHYTAVVFATGASGGSRKLQIPGEELQGVIGASDFVRYYNTMPFPVGSPRICPVELQTAREAVVIGNGNVALDCARVLATSYKRFCATDMNCVAVRELMRTNHIRRVNVVARRGQAHSSFAIAEFRELTRLQPEDDVRVIVDSFNLEEALSVPAANPRARKRLLELMSKFTSDNNNNRDDKVNSSSLSPPPDRNTRGPCLIHMRYNLRPIRFLPNPDRPKYLGAVVFERTDVNHQEKDKINTENITNSENESKTVILPCDIAITSVGYYGEAIQGIPFDHDRGIIPNERGRVIGHPRIYCAGWVKKGPSGAIVHALNDAQETVLTIIEDMEKGILPGCNNNNNDSNISIDSVDIDSEFYGKYGLIDFFVEKKLEPVSLSGVERILHVEKERGVDLGKRLEKIDSVRDMLDVALGGAVGKKANNSIRGIRNERPDALLYLNELLDDTTDLAPLARQLAKELPPIMAEQLPPGKLHPSQL